jgi:hypothetical protein
MIYDRRAVLPGMAFSSHFWESPRVSHELQLGHVSWKALPQILYLISETQTDYVLVAKNLKQLLNGVNVIVV